MKDQVNFYLKSMAKLLETNLLPSDPESQKIAKYSYRMLNVFRLREEILPKLQQKALKNIEQILDRLITELKQVDGNMIIVPQLIAHIKNQPDFEEALPYIQSAVGLLLADPTPKSNEIQRLLANIFFELEENFNREIVRFDFQPKEEKLKKDPLDSFQRNALQNYLRQHSETEKNIEIENITMIIAGGSKQTLIVELLNQVVLPSAIVLRIDQAGGVVNSKVIDEFNLIAVVNRAGIASPRAIAIETDTSVLGAPFMILSKVEGNNIGDWEHVNEPSRSFAEDLARTLALLHQIKEDASTRNLKGADITVKERLLTELHSYERHWRVCGESSVGLEQAFSWLKNHISFGEGRRSIIHVDVGCHNMLGKEGRLTALLDWETAVIGNPAQDLAYVKHTVEQMIPFNEFLSLYESYGGILPSTEEMDYYRLWRNVMVMHYEHMARSFFLSGHSDNLILGYSSQYVYQSSVHELHETMKLIYDRYPF